MRSSGFPVECRRTAYVANSVFSHKDSCDESMSNNNIKEQICKPLTTRAYIMAQLMREIRRNPSTQMAPKQKNISALLVIMAHSKTRTLYSKQGKGLPPVPLALACTQTGSRAIQGETIGEPSWSWPYWMAGIDRSIHKSSILQRWLCFLSHKSHPSHPTACLSQWKENII